MHAHWALRKRAGDHRAVRAFAAEQGYAPDFSETEAQREWAERWFFDANSPVTRPVVRS